MARPNTTQSIFHAFLYGGACVLLAFDIFLFARAIAQSNFIPILPILAGILISSGLMLVIYAEHNNRALLRREHRRLSRVAHQLESPLHSLKEDFVHLSADADKLPAPQRLQIKRMDTKTKILLDNIRDVFLMLRAEQGTISTETRLYDLCQLLDTIKDRALPLASAHNIEITTSRHCQHATVNIDRQLFLIALGHIIENGILYSLKPGIVNIALTKGRSSARIIVQDRGIGVKPQDASHIFLPYSRGDKADQFDPDGIGVGLTLAKAIIEEMGGTITWHSRQNTTGTEFLINLPLAKKGD